ncbi:putative baseplate assembly protein [Halogeometricum limi]|uniref:Putative baseplate assembly protein n=1 Tax=Halogeometricum limi TaxID=555875 RepID=A0A1I6IEG9_9EURY|nr:putative baseplate assembly protein [Halogeometricum limi]SFR65177.1 putative baseplate assembly protein [Halogeometricum limi]
MVTEPVVDGRTRDELLAESRALAAEYVSEWNPERGDVGATLLELFASMTHDVVERLDAVPEKYRRSFFETLGFDRAPPQSARLPLTFDVADELDRNVRVPESTRAVAPASERRPETFFEVRDGEFDATPAALRAVYSVRPKSDHLGDHSSVLAGPETTELFGGDNHQEHALYLAHDELFRGSPPTVRVDLATEAPLSVLRERLVWEFYGERVVDGEPVEGWHSVESFAVDRATQTDAATGTTVRVSLTFDSETADADEPTWSFTASTLAETVESVAEAIASETAATHPEAVATESLWLRCRYHETARDWGLAPTDLFEVTLDAVHLVTGEAGATFEPDELFADDVPLPPTSADEEILPLGSLPRQSSTFYVGSERAFTKSGAAVSIEFAGTGVAVDADFTPNPRLWWEYWDGDNWAYLDVAGKAKTLQAAGAVTFEVPADLAATTVAGQESHWVRARLMGGAYVAPKAVPKDADGKTVTDPTAAAYWETEYDGTPPKFSEVRLSFGSDGAEADAGEDADAGLPRDEPTHALSYNNLAFDADVTSPFFGAPDATQTLYLGFDAPLTDGPIQLLFSLADREFPADFAPRVRWEYASDPNRDAWEPLSVTDETEALTRRGIVGLVFPEATTASARFGRRLHWVRARVEKSQFGPPLTGATASPLAITHIDAADEYVELTNRGATRIDLSGYTVDFEYAQPASQLATIPAGVTLGPGATLGIATGDFSPVEAGPNVLRFDSTLPIINDYTPDTIAVLDREGRLVAVRTDDLDDDGRARLREGGEPDDGDGGSGDTETDAVGLCEDVDEWEPSPSDAIPPCGTALATKPQEGVPTRAPPMTTGVYVNAAWAENVQTVADETLGSSDGTQSQSFEIATTPVFEEALWVEESSALAARAREALLANPLAETVEGEGEGDGELWVRWTRVERLFGAASDARVYSLDPTAGVVTFGDGANGAIPPRGSDNVRVTYLTGGGERGNVPARAVDGLVSSLAFVDGVTNPEPGDGGAETERVERVLRRAPGALRDRNRAVAAADYERIARSASRRVARARCLPAMDAAGEFAPGWVTLLVVPRSSQPTPTPSAELRRLLDAAFADAAPAALVPPERLGQSDEEPPAFEPPGELVVRGPTYVDVDVETTVTRTAGVSVSALEETLTDRLTAFLHPLTGSESGEGWPFGTLPCLSDVYSLLEGVEGVDHVDSVELTFRGSDASVAVREGDPTPDVARDVLVTSGTHAVDASGGVA